MEIGLFEDCVNQQAEIEILSDSPPLGFPSPPKYLTPRRSARQPEKSEEDFS